MKNKYINLILAGIFLISLIFLINFASASIILQDDAIFKGYRILGIDGNESIFFTPALIGNGNVFRATEKFSGNLTREECILVNQTDMNGGCLQYKNVTYFQPNSLRHRNSAGLDNFISKIGNAFQYIIPLQPFLKWIKFGEQTITIVGDTSYNSTNINTTSETGFAHLNISNSSIKLYMPFDENYNSTFTYDYTNNSNDGTLVGGTIINTTGCVYGNCYTFDGVNDVVNINPVLTNNLATTTKGTWSAWVKVVDATAGTQMFIGFGDTDGFGGLGVYVRSSRVVEFFGFKTTSDWLKATTNPVINSGQWHHVALTYAPLDAIIYIDGVAVAQSYRISTNKDVWFANVSGLDNGRIGANNRNGAGDASFFNGSIDEVMIWNIALNSTEVLAIYNNQTNRFHGTGEMEFRNLNFGINDTTNISLKNCQTNMGSSLRAKVNNGAYVNFDGSCFIQDYNITGNLTNANLTIGFIGGNGTIPNTFYTPLVLGNITLNSTSSDILPPNISFATPTMNATNFSRSNIYANLSFADININFGAIFLYNITSDRINYIKGSTSPLEVNFTALADGTYYLNATANDTKGNINYTETRTIILDTTAPTFTINNPNGTIEEDSNPVLYSITTSESSACQASTDSGLRQWLNATDGNITHTMSLSLSNDYHTANFYCNDTLNNGETNGSVTFYVHVVSNYPSTLGGGVTPTFSPITIIGALIVNFTNMTIDSSQTNFYLDFKNKIDIKTFDSAGNLTDVDSIKVILLNNISNDINVFGKGQGKYVAEIDMFELKPEVLKFEIIATKGQKTISHQFEIFMGQKTFKEILIGKIQKSLEYVSKNKLLFYIFVLLTMVFFLLLFFIFKKSKKDKKGLDDLEF